jgi:uncharacterized protein
MDVLANMSSVQAAALWAGLLIVLMMLIKMWVGARRQALKIPSGDVTNAEFGRATRVQLNAVEDVPVLLAGIVALALLAVPAWYIHAVGALLLIARILHATGLSSSSGFSWGRLVGTAGTMIVYISVAGALIVHAFTSSF